ncbi:MAG: dNTP triphosphohydrolase [Planctomycetes bacterium]|nr:dNTP triphosphohydrolase [Planctomycetota bacterium]
MSVDFRVESEREERANLAPYAILSSRSRGRVYKEPEHPLRTAFQRDHDRVIYSSAFRRLEYKTQVFPNHEGDHYRTRMTHTIEVSALSRTLARILKLNMDFSETLGLVHDIGHPPFGHCGETILANLMNPFGGFEHNKQSHRLITLLENVYPNFPGLNLSAEVNESILQHSDTPQEGDTDTSPPYLETRLVSLADEIVYNAHDLEDGLSSGILEESQLRDLEFWSLITAASDYPASACSEIRRRFVVRSMMNHMVNDFINTSFEALRADPPSDFMEARTRSFSLLRFSIKVDGWKMQLENFLRKHMYRHPKVTAMMNKSALFMERIFEHYRKFPEELPLLFQQRILTEGLERTIADYIAGMTDRYLQEHYIRLFMPFQKML